MVCPCFYQSLILYIWHKASNIQCPCGQTEGNTCNVSHNGPTRTRSHQTFISTAHTAEQTGYLPPRNGIIPSTCLRARMSGCGGREIEYKGRRGDVAAGSYNHVLTHPAENNSPHSKSSTSVIMCERVSQAMMLKPLLCRYSGSSLKSATERSNTHGTVFNPYSVPSRRAEVLRETSRELVCTTNELVGTKKEHISLPMSLS